VTEALTFLGPAFVMCLVIASIHVYLGMHVLVREVIFVDLSLAQLAALGATVATVMEVSEEGYGVHFAGFAFTAIGSAIFAFTRRAREHLSQEAVVGIVYAVASAVMVLVLSHAPHGAEHIKSILVGSLLLTTWGQVWNVLLAYIVLGVIQLILARRFIQISWEKESVEPMRHVEWWDFGFYLLFGVVITISVQVAGILLVFSFLIVPAVITRLFSDRIGLRLAVGWGVAGVASILGLWGSWSWDLPTGATIVAAFGVLLVLAGVLRAFWSPSPSTG
jgi:zinc/manganese transport system permease protein